ncbi:hypothetical protein MTBSS4_270011 [Magnetospirillum sp. SS-4]|nr:hypothetical protein MTBSS4_270011 [Magnetospirillum sp. SS-4]
MPWVRALAIPLAGIDPGRFIVE